MSITRRDFLKLSSTIGISAVISLYSPNIKRVFAEVNEEGGPHVIWLQGAGDTGCTISLLQGSGTEESPDLVDVIRMFRLSVDFQPTIMIPSGDQAIKTLEEAAEGIMPLDMLIVEGAIPEGNYCTVGEIGGNPVPFKDWVSILGSKAKHVVAVGTCAAFGGIPAAMPNPTGCISVAETLQKEVINIPGCPPHPDWITLTLATVLSGFNPKLDSLNRPKPFFQDKIHTNCQLKRSCYDIEKYAVEPSDAGCLFRLGCKGKKTLGDCPIRHWNNSVSSCTSGLWSDEDTQVYPAGAPCIGCTEPEFPENPFSPFYEKLTEKEK